MSEFWQGILPLQHKGPESIQEFLKQSYDIHNLIAGIKALTTSFTMDGLEQCRRSLGGHGYCAYNAIPTLIASHGMGTAGAGDNTVLSQQCARYLVTSYNKILGGKKLSGSVEYLNNWETILKNGVSDKLNFKDPYEILAVLRYLSVKVIINAANLLTNDVSNGISMEDSWNNNMMQILYASTIHSILSIYESFLKSVDSATPSVKAIVTVKEFFLFNYL